jgi:hypothetical protein
MAIDFKEKFSTLKNKDVEPLTQEELGYIKQVEDYIDSEISKKLSTDNLQVYIDKTCVDFGYNPITKNMFKEMTSSRKKFLREELLSRYERANWLIDWYFDDGLDGPNRSGGDYLILKGKQ